MGSWIFITFFIISPFTAHIQRFSTEIMNSAVLTEIFISQKWVFFPTWVVHTVNKTIWPRSPRYHLLLVVVSYTFFAAACSRLMKNSILIISGHLRAQDKHRPACKLLKDYNQKILTFHSIYDYFALLKAFKRKKP